MTVCRKCTHGNDCWIRATMELRPGFSMVDLSQTDREIVIGASKGNCTMYEDNTE